MEITNQKSARFSVDEKQAQQKIAEELGYDNPKELGAAMQSSKELKKEVQGMMEELGFSRKDQAQQRGGPKNHPQGAGGASGAEAGSGDSEISGDDEVFLEKLARENGFIKGGNQGDIDTFLAAIRGGQITDPQILSSVGSIAGIDLKDIPGMEQSDKDKPLNNRQNALGISPPPEGDEINFNADE